VIPELPRPGAFLREQTVKQERLKPDLSIPVGSLPAATKYARSAQALTLHCDKTSFPGAVSRDLAQKPMLTPPSTGMTTPVMNLAAGDAR